MAVCDKRSSRHPRLTALAVRALPRDAIRMQAPFDTVGAILSALLLGSTIMAANSLQNATYQFGSLCWMALALR